MRVAQLIDGLYVGGAERLLVTFSAAAPQFDVHPTVIALRIYPETPFLEQLHSINTQVVEFRGRNLIDPFRFFRLVSYLRREKFDVAHVHLTYAVILGSLAAKLAGIPVVASVHNTQADRWRGLEIFALKRWADAVIAVGYEVAKAYQPRLGKKPMEIVLNAVDSSVSISPEERLALRGQLGAAPQEILILAVGRLFPQKGYDDLLDAMYILKQNHTPARLAIAGIGELRDHLSSKIEELGLQEMVSLLGSRNDVPKLLAASDIFASSSHWEGLPIAILEAMAAGLPVAATNVGDIPYVIQDNMGILVPPRQPKRLADALQRLCANPSLRTEFGANAQARVLLAHSPGAWVKQLFEIYKGVMK
ncbi:MAG: glycosyltransferase [Anaerolineales bacterium]|nr:glycosyltransferase [Anaerolineales bacterium]